MAEQEASAKKPIWKRWWFIALAILVIAGIGSSLGGDKDKTAAPRPSGTATGTPTSTRGPGIGDPVRDGKFEFVVSKVDCGHDRVGSRDFGDEAQGKFCFVHMTVENIGDEPQSFFGDNQLMFDAAGREFGADTEAQIYLDEGNAIYEEINPGNKVRGIVVFDIPKAAKPAKLELHDSAFSGGVDVVL